MATIDGRNPQAGFTLHEAMWGLVVLALALLGHAASAFSEHRMAQASRTRSEALHVARQLVERLRADEDFAGLLARIRLRQVDPAADAVPLVDGRAAYPPAAYCPGFVLPPALAGLLVRVEVPLRERGEDGFVLREDADEPWFGLPGDLDGDGVCGSEPCDLDYLALPVALTLQWAAPGHAPATMRLATWLRGAR